MNVANLAITVSVDASHFCASLKDLVFKLWVIQYGDAYDRATARIVTAIGLERTA